MSSLPTTRTAACSWRSRRADVNRLGALAQREYRLFFAGQAISPLGDGMVGVALSFAVLDLTGSVPHLRDLPAARALPLLGFLLLGGVFAARVSRRAVPGGP